MTAARNANITTGVTGVHTIVDEAPYVVIDKESGCEGEADSLRYALNIHNIEIERKVLVKTMDEEEDVDTKLNTIYTN